MKLYNLCHKAFQTFTKL